MKDLFLPIRTELESEGRERVKLCSPTGAEQQTLRWLLLQHV